MEFRYNFFNLVKCSVLFSFCIVVSFYPIRNISVLKDWFERSKKIVLKEDIAIVISWNFPLLYRVVVVVVIAIFIKRLSMFVLKGFAWYLIRDPSILWISLNLNVFLKFCETQTQHIVAAMGSCMWFSFVFGFQQMALISVKIIVNRNFVSDFCRRNRKRVAFIAVFHLNKCKLRL